MATVHLTDRARILLHHRSLTVPNGPEIVAQAPPGVNDYDYLRAFISAILTPDLPKAFYVNLVLLAILLLVGLVGSVAVIVWPFRQGRDSVQKNLWIIKRRYVSQCAPMSIFVPCILIDGSSCFRSTAVHRPELHSLTLGFVRNTRNMVPDLHLVGSITPLTRPAPNLPLIGPTTSRTKT